MGGSSSGGGGTSSYNNRGGGGGSTRPSTAGSPSSTSSPAVNIGNGPWCLSAYVVPGNLIDSPEVAHSALDCWKRCSDTQGCIASTWFYVYRDQMGLNYDYAMIDIPYFGEDVFQGDDYYGSCALFYSVLCPHSDLSSCSYIPNTAKITPFQYPATTCTGMEQVIIRDNN